MTTAAMTARNVAEGQAPDVGDLGRGLDRRRARDGAALGVVERPRAPTRYSVMLTRMTLSMIVVITSWAPR